MSFSDSSRSLQKARRAAVVMFFANGCLLGSWIPHIPLIQERLSLSESALGLALLAAGIGAFLSMPLSGLLSHRYGSHRITFLAGLAFCLALPFPIIASNYLLLAASLAFLGASTGSMDVAMNAQAVLVERQYGKAIMSSFHAFFSLGNLIGAGIGIFALSRHASPSTHAIAIGSALGIAILAFAPRLLRSGDDAQTVSNQFRLPTGPLIGIGALTFLSFMTEGAVADWSGVYLQNTHNAAPGISSAGFAAFALAMTLGRLTGDRVIRELGSRRTLQISAPIAACGLGISVLANHPNVAVAGFALVGIGLSNLVPIFFSAAGRTSGLSASNAIAAVATAGYFGLLAGPPLIGFLAEAISLRATLGLLALLLLLPAFSSGRLR